LYLFIFASGELTLSPETLFHKINFDRLLVVLSLILLLAPNFLLGMFFLPKTAEVWIRVVGMLVLYLGYYYIQAAKSEMKNLIRWSVYVRSTPILFFIVFVMFGLVNWQLILFGVVDLLSAIWTGMALRSSKTV